MPLKALKNDIRYLSNEAPKKIGPPITLKEYDNL